MPEELRMLFAGLAKAAAEGKVVVGNADDLPKEVKDVMAKVISGLEDHENIEEMQKIAALSKELGDDMKPAIVAAAKSFVAVNGLPEEQFLDYVIYGAIANTLKFVLDDEDDDDDDECDCCRCQQPKNPPSDNGSAKAEAEAEAEADPDAVFAAINALKAILNNKRG